MRIPACDWKRSAAWLFPVSQGRRRGACRVEIADRFVDRLHARTHADCARAAMERRPTKQVSSRSITTAPSSLSIAYVARRAPGLPLRAKSKDWSIRKPPPKRGRKRMQRWKKCTATRTTAAPCFRRLCVSCHKVGNTGYTFGPDLSEVAKRLNRHDILESIIEPSKKVDPKYVTTTIMTGEGQNAGRIYHQEDQRVRHALDGRRQASDNRDWRHRRNGNDESKQHAGESGQHAFAQPSFSTSSSFSPRANNSARLRCRASTPCRRQSADQASSRGKWMALAAALLGWLFDGFEMGMFPLVGKNALVRAAADARCAGLQRTSWFGVIMAVFLIGAATGGVVFGWLGDRVGPRAGDGAQYSHLCHIHRACAASRRKPGTSPCCGLSLRSAWAANGRSAWRWSPKCGPIGRVRFWQG